MKKVFDRDWFDQHQSALLTLVNHPLGRIFFHLDGKKSSVGNRTIIQIEPNSITWVAGKKGDDFVFQTEFRTHDRFAKRLYYGLYPLWRVMHEWDRVIAEPLCAPLLDFGFSTLTAQPVAGATSPCDGPVNRVGVDEAFATIIAAAGNQGGLESTVTDTCCAVKASTTSNQFAEIRRSGFNFDTSSIGSGASVSAAVMSIVSNFKTNGLGADSYDCVDFNPAATNAIPSTAFVLFGSTSYANIAYASLDAGGTNYNDWTLDSNGISNLSLTGVSSYGLRSGWDRSGTFGGVWASGAQTRFQARYADTAGTGSDPKLVVTYTASGGGGIPNKLVQVAFAMHRGASY